MSGVTDIEAVGEHHHDAGAGHLERLDDDALTGLVRSGHNDAFGVLYRRHAAGARKMACQRLGSSDVDDVVSEVFAGVLRALRNGRGPSTGFEFYLRASVRNQCISHQKRAATSVRWEDDGRFDGPSGPDEQERHAVSGVVADAFRTLSPRWQRVLWYSAVEQLPSAEIARRMSIRVEAVHAVTMRARQAFAVAYLEQHTARAAFDSCRHVAPLLARYVRGHAGAGDVFRVESHLDDCSVCRRAVEELRNLNTSLRTLPAPAGLAAAAVWAWLTKAVAVGVVALAGSGIVGPHLAAPVYRPAPPAEEISPAPTEPEVEVQVGPGSPASFVDAVAEHAAVTGSDHRTGDHGTAPGAVDGPAAHTSTGLPPVGGVPVVVPLPPGTEGLLPPPTVTTGGTGASVHVPLPVVGPGGGATIGVDLGATPGVSAVVDAGLVGVAVDVDTSQIGANVAVPLVGANVPVHVPLPPAVGAAVEPVTTAVAPVTGPVTDVVTGIVPKVTGLLGL